MTVTLGVGVDIEIAEFIDEIAKERDIARNALLKEIITEWYKYQKSLILEK